jgi:hypothetical protein
MPSTARFVLWVAALALFAQSCATGKRLPAVPAPLTTRAEVLGIANARFWVDGDLGPYLAEALAAFEREKKLSIQTETGATLPTANFLALSGGGDNGAFGAGLLAGWTQSGNRPPFKLVTGISTGALIAPFAFLGADYDPVLRDVYTGVGPNDIYRRRSLIAALNSDALSDNGPLWQLVREYVNEDLIRRTASEYGKGRLLLVGTTNLDCRRPVVWNLGAIAASGHPKALDLFCSVLVASAAIPGAFPPVMIPIELDGKSYEEMHVDGGACAQIMVFPPSLLDLVRSRGVEPARRERKLYLIRNDRIDPQWASVQRHLVGIAARSISSLIHMQGVGDLYRIYLLAAKEGMDYNLAYIGSDFEVEHREEFDTAYMRALFDYGFRLGREGYAWKRSPPGLSPLEQ